MREGGKRKRVYNFIIDDKQGQHRVTTHEKNLMDLKENEIKRRKKVAEEHRKQLSGEKRKRTGGKGATRKKTKPSWVEGGKKRKQKSKGTQGKKKQTKITNFITGNTKEPEVKEKKRPRPEDRKKVTRKEILTEILQITKLENINKREKSEKRWGAEEIRQYRKKKKNSSESTAAKSRATQGWIMKNTVKNLRKIGRENKLKPEEVDEKILNIIAETVRISHQLHKESICRNRSRRKKEGLRLQFTKNSRGNYKAIMNMKTKQDAIGIG